MFTSMCAVLTVHSMIRHRIEFILSPMLAITLCHGSCSTFRCDVIDVLDLRYASIVS
jgi:hypothetical protein